MQCAMKNHIHSGVQELSYNGQVFQVAWLSYYYEIYIQFHHVWIHIYVHWNGNIFSLMKSLSLAALEMTTSIAAIDENFIEMMAFPLSKFQSEIVAVKFDS